MLGFGSEGNPGMPLPVGDGSALGLGDEGPP